MLRYSTITCTLYSVCLNFILFFILQGHEHTVGPDRDEENSPNKRNYEGSTHHGSRPYIHINDPVRITSTVYMCTTVILVQNLLDRVLHQECGAWCEFRLLLVSVCFCFKVQSRCRWLKYKKQRNRERERSSTEVNVGTDNWHIRQRGLTWSKAGWDSDGRTLGLLAWR